MITIRINGKTFYSLTPLQLLSMVTISILNAGELIMLKEGDLIEVTAESEDLINTVREMVSYKGDENES